MDYSLLVPPSSRPRMEMTRREARGYFEWFVDQIPRRVAVLERAVQSSERGAFRAWAADRTPDSLDMLGDWLAAHVESSPVSEAYSEEWSSKLEEIDPKYRQIFQQPRWLLTTETISLVHDVGMYLGEVLRASSPELEWKLWTRGKRDLDYQEPVLTAPMLDYGIDPLQLVHVIALKMAKGSAHPNPLRRLYDVWVDKVSSGRRK